MSTTPRLYDAIKDFPDPVLAEIVDFAEFLREKRLNIHLQASEEPLIKLAGGLEKSEIFADEPLALQARMRDEWNFTFRHSLDSGDALAFKVLSTMPEHARAQAAPENHCPDTASPSS